MKSLLKTLARRLLPESSYQALAARAQKSRDLRAFQEWTVTDQRRLDFYRQFVSKDSLVFDVGANLGNRSKIFLKLGARVVAFEPQEPCANFLNEVFDGTQHFQLVRKALGAAPGSAEMLISSDHTISSLSTKWVQIVEETGRFAEDKPNWNQRKIVPIDTLDQHISLHGCPAFIKIDVEGFEDQVLAGLSRPVPALSMEFTPEYLESTWRCIEHLCRMSNFEFQLSLGESMQFILPDWTTSEGVRHALANVPQTDFGDLYARLVS
jgi:FkbM family methyltransferase